VDREAAMLKSSPVEPRTASKHKTQVAELPEKPKLVRGGKKFEIKDAGLPATEDLKDFLLGVFQVA